MQFALEQERQAFGALAQLLQRLKAPCPASGVRLRPSSWPLARPSYCQLLRAGLNTGLALTLSKLSGATYNV